MKTVAVLGSTGSIGTNALKVIRSLKGSFRVVALAADSNIELLSAQAREFRPRVVSIGNEYLAARIRGMLPPKTKVIWGEDGLSEIARDRGVDTTLFAVAGNACLKALVEAVGRGKRIALANKEALVSAGPLIMRLAEKKGAEIIPVDSEHSAIFQCVEARRSRLSRIYLTGSGGPLLNIDRSRFDSLSRAFILHHPKWRMGKKISVDSATMMNKALEIIEASYLFGIDESKIEILIHPEALVHSMAEFEDSAVIAQIALPDMRLPIQYALTYPERRRSLVGSVDFPKAKTLSFFKPDTGKFPSLGLARRAVRDGSTAPCVLCAADEIAVAAYLNGSIPFSRIAFVIEKVLSRRKAVKGPMNIKDVFAADAWAREEALSICSR